MVTSAATQPDIPAAFLGGRIRDISQDDRRSLAACRAGATLSPR
jgi:hypothetical protein